jgi:hypothetical protein
MAYCISRSFSKVLNFILQRILSNALFPKFWKQKGFQEESNLKIISIDMELSYIPLWLFFFSFENQTMGR